MIPDSGTLSVPKANYKKALKAVQAVKLTITTQGAKESKLYANLLLDEAR